MVVNPFRHHPIVGDLFITPADALFVDDIEDKGSGVQTLILFIDGLSTVYLPLNSWTEAWRQADGYIASACHTIEFQWFGYDCLVRSDDGDIIGTDGYPDGIGRYSWDDEAFTWEAS